MSLTESSVLLDRALVTVCQDLPESLGLYNTAKDVFSLTAIRAIPLLEHVASDSRKFALIRDWMRTFEPAEDQALSDEINLEVLKEKDRQGRKERARKLQRENHEQKNKTKEKTKKKTEEKTKKKEKKNQSTKETSSYAQKTSSTMAPKRLVVLDESSSSNDESESSTSSSSLSSESESESRARKRTKTVGNLPPIELVLSSDEEEEPNEMFDTEDPDVYEVETIIRKKKGETYGEQDLYEVKWEGYEETTWEPASNISKDLIDEFEGQPVREDVYTVQEIVDRRSKRDSTTKLKTHQYKVKWVGYDDLTWEPAENLPHNLRRKFDQKYETRKRRRS